MYVRAQRGFTLIELLVVIAIIGILSSIVYASLGAAREEAKQAVTLAQLKEIKQAIFVLELHTGRSVGGCPLGAISTTGNELSIADSPRTGLYSAPTDFAAYGSCQWTTAQVAKWQGPYITTPIDPWGYEYYYDSDYFPRQDCGNPSVSAAAVAVSGGPNGYNGGADSANDYDCDDIYVLLDS